MARPVLVTGAAGFAGRHLVALLEQDGPVEGWYRPGAPPSQPNDDERVRWRAVDLREADQVHEALATLRPAAIYHLAGAANQGAAWAQTDITFDLNVRVTHTLLRAVARHVPDARVLVTTSAAVYAASEAPLDEDARVAPATPYGVSKLAQEMCARAAALDEHLEVFVVRPFNHIGPGQDPAFAAPAFARQLARIEAGLDAGPIRVGNLEPRRDMTDVRDTVRAYRLLMTHAERGSVYNVCRGDAFAMSEVLDGLRAATRVPVDVEVDPAKLRPVDVPVLVGDRRKLTTRTGWEPTIPLEQTLLDILAEQRARLA